MKLFALDFGGMMIRYYVMMGLILGAFFIGLPLLAILAFPVFLSAILGVKFFGNDQNIVGHNFNTLNQDEGLKNAA